MASVGDILRDKRIEQNRSIEQVAAATKIRANILHSIENNELDILPLPYVKSFVKTYAKLLGLSDKEEIKNFLEPQVAAQKTYRSAPAATEATPPRPPAVKRSKSEAPIVPAIAVPAPDTVQSVATDARQRPHTLVNIIVATALVLGALAVAYYFVFNNSTPTASTEQDVPSTQPVEVTSDPVIVASPSVDSAALESVPEQDSLILEARATAKVWISIVADGKRSSQMTLDVDNTYRWSADSIFTLSLGNAGGVQFTLNGKPLRQMGKAGAIVRNIRITRNGIVSSSQPYNSSLVTPPATQQKPTRSAEAQRAAPSSNTTRQTTRQSERQTTRQSERQTTRQSERQTTRQNERQATRQNERQATQRSTRQRQNNEQRRRASVPLITPAETKSPPPSLPPADKRTPINE